MKYNLLALIKKIIIFSDKDFNLSDVKIFIGLCSKNLNLYKPIFQTSITNDRLTARGRSSHYWLN